MLQIGFTPLVRAPQAIVCAPLHARDICTAAQYKSGVGDYLTCLVVRAADTFRVQEISASAEISAPLHSALALPCRDLLIASLGQFLRNCRQIAEQASGFLVGAGGEVDVC